MTSIHDWIASRSEGAALGRRAAQVVEIIATQPRLAAYASAADLARRAGVNVATVVRAAQGLGYSGWPELRLELRGRYLASLSANQVLTEHDRSVSDPVIDTVQRDMDNLDTLARTLDPEGVRALAAAIHAAQRTLVVGSGTFAAPGLQLAHAAAIMGHDIRLEQHGGTQLVNQLTRLRRGDCLVAFNFWWLPREILHAAQVAWDREATVCVVTDRHTSPLAEVAGQVLMVPSEGASMFPSLTASMSVVGAVLAEMTRLGGEGTRQAVEDTEALWRRLGLFDLPT